MKIVSLVAHLALLLLVSCVGDPVENVERRQEIQDSLPTEPVISTISPSESPIAGGGTLTITGARLENTVVSVGGSNCSIATQSATIITCTLPSGSAGSADVVVMNGDGESATNSNFTYRAAPTVTSIDTSYGVTTGGTAVVITGTGFYNITDIQFGAISCTSIVTVSDTSASCTTGANSAGTYDITVTNGDGQTGSGSNLFTYETAPTITSFSPTTIYEAGSQTLTINGTNFISTPTVTIDGTACGSVTFNSATQITCTTAAGSGTSRNVVVTNPSGIQVSSTIDYIAAPTITDIDRNFGTTAGSDTIVITGTGFVSGGSFGITAAGVACTTSTFTSATSVSCTTAAGGPATNKVVVTNNDGQTATSTEDFTYRGAPGISTITPSIGAVGGGTTVTIGGSGFSTDGKMTVSIGGSNCGSVNVTSATSLTCTTPSGSAGQVDVTVTNTEDSQTSNTLTNGFEYQVLPTVTSISPRDFGPLAGTNTITINGTGFLTGATVDIGGNACTSPNVLNANQITCVVPANAVAGAKTLTVTNSGGSLSASLATGYTYTAAPTVTSVSPKAGPTAGNQTITITGTNFFDGVTFDINSVACTSPTYVSATSATCVTPTNGGVPGGPFTVDVANTDGQTGSTPTAYKYIDPPTVTSITPNFGLVTGGTTITVVGTGYYTSEGITVTINGVTCTVDAGTLTATGFECETGDNSGTGTGTYELIVKNNVDNQVSSSGVTFEYMNPPTITEIQESGGGRTTDGGSLNGGNTIRVVGTGFKTGIDVKIGTIDCANENLIDVNNVECDIPAGPHTAQAENVTITNTDTQTVTLTNGYTFRAEPTIVSYDYAFGPTTGGNTITITGTNFYNGANFKISIGGTDCSTSTYVDTETATCVVPSGGTLGAQNVVLTSHDLQTVTDTGAFTFVDTPTITTFSPTSIYEVGTQALTINGTNFQAGSTVTINSLECTTPNVVSATQITCTTPASSGTGVAVVVTQLDGQTASSTIDYKPAPTISTYDYAFGPTTGGNTITLTGTGFEGGGSFDITIGSNSCTTPAVTNATTATCIVPGGGTLGSAAVVLTNNDGQTATDATGFAYVVAPTVTSFSPTTIYEAGSQTLTITGTGFLDGATVDIGGSACASPTVVDANTITCTTPTGTGSPTVTVTNQDGQTGTLAITYLPAPTISTYSPTSLHSDGDGTNLLTINGTGFVSAPTVEIDGNTCGTVTFVNATQITCDYPAGTAGTVNVVLTNPDGQVATGTTTIDYKDAPTISSFDYAFGPTTGGNTITLTGTNFGGGGSFNITIGGNSCTSPAVTNATTATCQVPGGGTLGTATVVLINNDGQTATDSTSFSYVAAPVVSSFSPGTIYEAGNQTLTITGTGFLDGATVDIGGSACGSPTVVSSSSITCTTPSGTGTPTVTVTNRDGQTGTSTINYLPVPTITTFSPTTIKESGSETLTINGTGFVSAPSVTVGGNACGSVTFNSANQITCTTPAGSGSGAAVVLTNPDGQTVSSTIDYKPAPVITSAVTSNGAYGQSGVSETLTLTGTGFFDDIGSPTITINSIACTSPTVVSSTSITCSTQTTAAGTYDVVITNADGQTHTLSNGFTFTDSPGAISVSPTSGTIDGGTSLTITGNNFITGTTVTIGGVNCIGVNVASSTSITCTTPSASAGAATISLTVPAQTAATTTYTYTNNAPSISSISPQGGPIAGGTAVTISGSNFDPAMTDGAVKIGGINCTGVSASATSITCTTDDNGSAGYEDVVVTNPDAQSDTLATGFLFATGPTVSSISPSSGDISGGTSVTITGTDFAASASVTIGGTACSNVNVSSATTITCNVPSSSSAGDVDVVVTQYFQSSTLTDGFTYTNGPVLAWKTGVGSPQPPNPADWGDPGADTGFTFTLENTGVATSSTITVSITGTNAAVWNLVSDNCSGTTLASGATCTVQAFFNWSLLPDGATVYQATLEATATSGGTTTNAMQGQNLP